MVCEVVDDVALLRYFRPSYLDFLILHGAHTIVVIVYVLIGCGVTWTSRCSGTAGVLHI